MCLQDCCHGGWPQTCHSVRWPCKESCFPGEGWKECPVLVWKVIDIENGEKELQ